MTRALTPSEASGFEPWHRGWHISKSFFGYWFQHPGFDPENPSDWRHGYAASPQAARDEIDVLLTENAEWDAAVAIVRGMTS